MHLNGIHFKNQRYFENIFLKTNIRYSSFSPSKEEIYFENVGIHIFNFSDYTTNRNVTSQEEIN